MDNCLEDMLRASTPNTIFDGLQLFLECIGELRVVTLWGEKKGSPNTENLQTKEGKEKQNIHSTATASITKIH